MTVVVPDPTGPAKVELELSGIRQLRNRVYGCYIQECKQARSNFDNNLNAFSFLRTAVHHCPFVGLDIWTNHMDVVNSVRECLKTWSRGGESEW